MHLQKVVAGAGDGQLEEVQPDTPAAERGDRQGVHPIGRRQVVCLYALTCRRQAGPLHRAARQSERLVATEVPAQRYGAELVQHLRAKRARGRDAKAIAAPAAAVQQPVAAYKGAARWAGRGGVLRLCRRPQGPQNRSDVSATRSAAAKSASRKQGDSAAGSAATKAEAGAAPDAVQSSSAKSGLS